MTTAGFTAEEASALAQVDEAAIVRTLLELIAIPSVTGTTAEAEIQHDLAGRLGRLGLDVDLWSMDLPGLRAHPGFPGAEAPREEAWGLVAATDDGGDGPTVILQGHVDVVPPGDPERWEGDPFVPRVVGDTVYGRGACDMKAGLVAHLAALTAIRASGIRLRGRVGAPTSWSARRTAGSARSVRSSAATPQTRASSPNPPAAPS